MTFYGPLFPNVRTIPKQHVLEAHSVCAVDQALGVWSGAASRRAGRRTARNSEHVKTKGVRNDKNTLHLLMKEQPTHASPALLATPLKERK